MTAPAKPFADRLAELRERATRGPWSCDPRSCTDADKIRAGMDSIQAASESDEDFLGWYVVGPKVPGRGDFLGNDAALIAFLANHAAAIEKVVRAADEIVHPRSFRDHLTSHVDLRDALSELDQVTEKVTG